MLVDEGKLRWDDRVIDHIPELRLYDRHRPPERYAGTYADSAFGTVDVTLTGAAFRARFEKADVGKLDHAQHNVFCSRPVAGVGAVTLTLVPDGMG